MLVTAQILSAPQSLTAQLAISTCPGDFNVVADCTAFGSVWSGGTQLIGGTGASPIYGGCPMTAGVQYYVNVREVLGDLTTPSCPSQFCEMLVNYNTNIR